MRVYASFYMISFQNAGLLAISLWPIATFFSIVPGAANNGDSLWLTLSSFDHSRMKWSSFSNTQSLPLSFLAKKRVEDARLFASMCEANAFDSRSPSDEEPFISFLF